MGIGAFLAFALMHALQVVVVLGTNAIDVVKTYAPWAEEVCSERTLFVAVGARVVVIQA